MIDDENYDPNMDDMDFEPAPAAKAKGGKKKVSCGGRKMVTRFELNFPLPLDVGGCCGGGLTHSRSASRPFFFCRTATSPRLFRAVLIGPSSLPFPLALTLLPPSAFPQLSPPRPAPPQKKTQLEHILLRPDTYIGSTEKYTSPMNVLNPVSKRLEKKEITYVPGLYKIFDEILVNASDNKQRDTLMDKLDVTIDPETNTISVRNNGKGIPIVMHKEHNVYVPELIFGLLLTGSNFDDDEKKVSV